MSIYTRNRLLGFIIILLIALNISTIVTVRYRMKKHIESYDADVEHYQDQRGKHFREELNLDKEQFEKFKQYRKQYYPIVYNLQSKMHEKRLMLLEELSKENTDTVKLNEISREIGRMHTEMKIATNKYFINLKSVCTREQQLKLFKFYKAILAPGHGVNRAPFGKGKHKYKNSKDTVILN
jgi:Spy/CpxP family protein refolding chaperone